MARPTENLEKQPLLSPPSHPRQGFGIHSLRKEPVLSYRLEPQRHTPLSFRAKIILGMVAIPAYLLASSAVTTLGPLWPRDTVIRSAEPEPESTSTQTDPLPNPFSSVAGPLVEQNFPDPAIIVVDGVSYAFATNNRGKGADMVHVQVATSTDNQTWTLLDHHDALPSVGAWETGARVWAPDVVQVVSCASLEDILGLTCGRTTARSFYTTPMRSSGVRRITVSEPRLQRISSDLIYLKSSRSLARMSLHGVAPLIPMDSWTRLRTSDMLSTRSTAIPSVMAAYVEIP